MITVRRDGWIIGKFYKHLNMTLPTNLCALFWKTFFAAGAVLVAGLIVGTYLIGAFWVWLDVSHIFSVVFIAISLVGGVLAAAAYADHKHVRIKFSPGMQQVGRNIKEAWYGFKDKFCPFVEWAQPGE